MMGVFILLIAAHFGLHFYFKSVKRKKAKQQKTASTTDSSPASDKEPNE
jgi:preprotein translocase subunit YajC